MSRKSQPDAITPAPEDIETAKEREVNERQQLVVAEFGDGLPWQPEHYESEIRAELRRGCESFLRAGRLLVVARDCASHGEWSDMLSRLGMEARQAQRMMEAARRISPNASTSTHLLAAAKSQGKLIELLSLPEEQFNELAETGETGGLDLADIARMTVRELRSAVRDAREDISTKNDRAAAREREIERLQSDLRKAHRRFEEAQPDEVAEKLKVEVIKAAGLVAHHLGAELNTTKGLSGALTSLHEHCAEHCVNHAPWVMAQLDDLQRQIDVLRLRWSAGV